MKAKFIRIPFVTIFAGVGALLGYRGGELWVGLRVMEELLDPGLRILTIGALTAVGGLLGILVASLSFSKALRVFSSLEEAPMADKLAGAAGCVLGLMVGVLLNAPLVFRAKEAVIPPLLGLAILVLFAFLGISFGLSMKDELGRLLGRGASRAAGGSVAGGTDGVSEAERVRAKLLDTNVIIDGRIADICSTGFVEGPIYVPGFVLRELQHVADSADSLRRARGRRGLMMLNRMQRELANRVEVLDDYGPDYDESEPVDIRLVKLGKWVGAGIISNDFNLNRIGELHGVQVLSVNQLANALKPVFLHGEELAVEIVRQGKEPHQGVGYLDDGTMVVIENGESRLGELVTATVTSVLQTPNGKMIFAQLANGDARSGGVRRR